MKPRFFAFFVGMILLALSLHAVEKPVVKAKKIKVFGAKPAISAEPITLTQAVAVENIGKNVKVQAKVEEVCQSMGCWLIVREGEVIVRIKTKDHKFFVPKNIAGRTVVVEGIIQIKAIEESLARHYAEDAGQSQSEIEAIQGDQNEISMIASSVTLLP